MGHHTPHDVHAAGWRGERRAERFYIDRGYAVVARNWRGGGGEIDLVVVRDDVLAAVEVRVRSRGEYGSAAASVTTTKQRRVLGAVRAFVAAYPEWLADGYRTVRLDVVAIDRGRVDVIYGAL